MSEPQKETPQQQQPQQEKAPSNPKENQKGGKQGQKQEKGQQQQQGQKKEKGGQQQQQQQKKEKGQQQQQQQGQKKDKGGQDKTAEEDKKDQNTNPMFAHLPDFTQRNWEFVMDQHPSVVKASMAISNMKILGSNARCIAILSALIDALKDFPVDAYNDSIQPLDIKKAISSYINRVVEYFVTDRPISHGTGNAIFEIKNFISMTLPDVITQDYIDSYISKTTRQGSQSPALPQHFDIKETEEEIAIAPENEKENSNSEKNFAEKKEESESAITSEMTSSSSSIKKGNSLSLLESVSVPDVAPIDNNSVSETPQKYVEGNNTNYVIRAFLDDLITYIRSFIFIRIYKAESILISHGASKIADGDVVLTYGYSYCLEKIFIEAHSKQRKEFKVVIIDSHPLFEGRRMLEGLTAAGIECTYALLSGLSYAIKPCTKVILGASALLKNGYGLARAGTALVTTAAKAYHIPVIFCCESYKFTPKVQLDSIIYNQIGDPDAIANNDSRSYNADFDAGKLPKKKTGFSTIFDEEMEDDEPRVSITLSDSSVMTQSGKGQQQQQQQQQQQRQPRKMSMLRPTRLKMLNVMLDVTPIENIAMVICEHGCIPPTTVPVIIDEYLRYNNE